jgi:molybdopterin converting factor small subunit
VATVRYFAAARAAAGVDAEAVPAGSLKELVDLLGERHGTRLTRILGGCSFLVDGLSCREPVTPLTEASTVDVLPPFAGG